MVQKESRLRVLTFDTTQQGGQHDNRGRYDVPVTLIYLAQSLNGGGGGFEDMYDEDWTGKNKRVSAWWSNRSQISWKPKPWERLGPDAKAQKSGGGGYLFGVRRMK